MPHRDGDWDEEPEYDFDPDVEDYERYDEDESGGKRRSLMMLSVVALLVVFAGVVFLAYRQGTPPGGDGVPPLLRADGEPTKEAPENPGGKAFPHRDAGVYNRITGDSETDSADGEQLLPPAEEPLAIDNGAAVPREDRQALDRMAAAVESAPIDDVPPVEEAAPPAEQTAPTQDEPVIAASGGYVVQLAAFRDDASAREAFGKLQTKYPDLLGGLKADIQRADLGEKGIYYRLRAGYMDKDDAAVVCGAFNAKGQGCLVRQR